MEMAHPISKQTCKDSNPQPMECPCYWRPWKKTAQMDKEEALEPASQ